MSSHDIISRIEHEVSHNEVVFYMRGSSPFPMCSVSSAVVLALESEGVSFVEVDLLKEPSLAEGLYAYSGVRALPQLYVRGCFVDAGSSLRHVFETSETYDQRVMLPQAPVIADHFERAVRVYN